MQISKSAKPNDKSHQNGAPVKKTKKPNVSNLIKTDPVKPIPFEHNGHSFSYPHNSFYLPFLTSDTNTDNYAQHLLEARLLSPTNNACITTKKDYCAGDGFMDTNGQDLDQRIRDWFSVMNLDGDHVTAINQNIFEDFFTWGNVPIELVRFTVGGEKRFFVNPHNFLEWKLAKPDDNDVIHEALQSKLFLRDQGTYLTQEQITKSRRLPIYSPLQNDKDNWLREGGVERTLIWYKNRVSGFFYYGMPSNLSSMIHQILEYKAARYNLDQFDNNMVVAAILALKGNLSQHEADRIARKVITSHTGDGKRGRTIVVASEEGIDSSNFHRMDPKTDGSYIESEAQWSEKIILSNEWDAILAGILSPSTLGKGAGFLTKILEIKLNTVIRPAQQHLVDKVWRHIFTEADKWLNLGLDRYHLEIRNNIDISGLTDVDITPAVQINEVRTAKGLQPDPKKDGVYMTAKGTQPQTDQQQEQENSDV